MQSGSDWRHVEEATSARQSPSRLRHQNGWSRKEGVCGRSDTIRVQCLYTAAGLEWPTNQSPSTCDFWLIPLWFFCALLYAVSCLTDRASGKSIWSLVVESSTVVVERTSLQTKAERPSGIECQAAESLCSFVRAASLVNRRCGYPGLQSSPVVATCRRLLQGPPCVATCRRLLPGTSPERGRLGWDALPERGRLRQDASSRER